MSKFDTLPVILVSAINETAATALMNELIDNDVTDDYFKDTQCLDRVWRLVNKYYTVTVRVHSLTDHGLLGVDPDAIEAHVIHITEEELLDESVSVARAAARAAGGAGAWRRCGVRLVLADAAAEPGALAAWAGAERADAVALRAGAEAGEPSGLQRARSALHAHVWRGLVRTDRAARPPPPEASSRSGSEDSDGSGGSDGSDSEAEELRAVERAEAFAAALGALGPALESRPGPHAPLGPHAPPDSRERAEQLVLAFCRALGLDLDTC